MFTARAGPFCGGALEIRSWGSPATAPFYPQHALLGSEHVVARAEYPIGVSILSEQLSRIKAAPLERGVTRQHRSTAWCRCHRLASGCASWPRLIPYHVAAD